MEHPRDTVRDVYTVVYDKYCVSFPGLPERADGTTRGARGLERSRLCDVCHSDTFVQPFTAEQPYRMANCASLATASSKYWPHGVVLKSSQILKTLLLLVQGLQMACLPRQDAGAQSIDSELTCVLRI